MCGAYSHVSQSFFSRRSMLRLCFDSAEIFSSCHSFVEKSTLPWSHDTQIHGSRRIEEAP